MCVALSYNSFLIKWPHNNAGAGGIDRESSAVGCGQDWETKLKTEEGYMADGHTYIPGQISDISRIFVRTMSAKHLTMKVGTYILGLG